MPSGLAALAGSSPCCFDASSSALQHHPFRPLLVRDLKTTTGDSAPGRPSPTLILVSLPLGFLLHIGAPDPNAFVTDAETYRDLTERWANYESWSARDRTKRRACDLTSHSGVPKGASFLMRKQETKCAVPSPLPHRVLPQRFNCASACLSGLGGGYPPV